MSGLPQGYFASVRTYDTKGEGTQHLCVGHTQAAADAIAKETGEKAIAKGHRVVWANGDEQWVQVSPVWQGSVHDYVWHEDGNRVKCERFLVTKRDGQIIERKLLGTSWRLEENL